MSIKNLSKLWMLQLKEILFSLLDFGFDKKNI